MPCMRSRLLLGEGVSRGYEFARHLCSKQQQKQKQPQQTKTKSSEEWFSPVEFRNLRKSPINKPAEVFY